MSLLDLHGGMKLAVFSKSAIETGIAIIYNFDRYHSISQEGKMKKKVIFLVLVLSFLFGIHPLYASTQLKRLGANPFLKVEALRAEAIYPIIMKNKEDARLGFIKAGAVNLFHPFMEQLKTAKIDAVQVPPGETFMWMIFKKKKKVFVLNDVEWAGKAPFEGYRLVIEHNKRAYEFIIPKVCFNIALKSVADIPVKAPVKAEPKKEVAKVVEALKNQPPQCNLTVSPKRFLTGSTVISDASKSIDSDGKIVSVTFTITDSKGSVVEEKVVEEAPFIYKTKMKKAGVHKIQAMVKDDAGDESPVNSCTREVTALKRGFFIGDIELLQQFDPATSLPIRVGYMHKFTEKVAITALVGGAPLLNGRSDNPATIVDIMLSYYPVPKFFLSAGTGMWHTTFKTRTDFILDTGYQFTDNPNGPNFSIYLEGRSAFDEFDNISGLGRFGGGIRAHF